MSLSVLNMLGGGGGNAPYAWAKYEAEYCSFESINRTESGKATITSTNLDLDNMTESDFRWFKGKLISNSDSTTYDAYFSYDNDVLKLNYANSSPTATYDSTTHTLSFSTNLSYVFDFVGFEFVKKTFIEYVTDKSPTKYPNGEIHTDGYFYNLANYGLYVWERHNRTETPIVLDNSQSWTTAEYKIGEAGGTVYLSDTYEFDSEAKCFKLTGTIENLNLANAGASGGYKTYKKYYMYNTTTGNTLFENSATNTSRMGSVYNSSSNYAYTKAYSASYPIYIHTIVDTILIDDEFVDFVVSDSDERMIDYGFSSDGHFYKRASGSSVISGTFSPTSYNNKIEIMHDMGSIPKRIVIEMGVMYQNDYIGYMLWTSGSSAKYYYGNSGAVSAFTGSVDMNVDSTKFTIAAISGASWKTGTTYRWYAVR